MLRSDRFAPLLGALGLGAILFLVAALVVRSSGLLPWVFVLAGAEYAVFLVIREGSIDGWAPVYGAGILLVAELAYWSIERRVPGAPEEGLTSRRATLVFAACVAAGGVGGLILAIGELSIRGGLWLEAIGVAAAVGAIALLARLARQA
jgi:hypothetical protein